MRRIFGASSITGSSTSTSLASDALPSPTSTSGSHDLPVQRNSDVVHSADAQAKSWLGLTRSSSHSSVSARASAAGPASGSQPSHVAPGSSRLGEPFKGPPDDEFDFGQLPFGAARSPAPPLSPPGRRRDSARSSVGAGHGAALSRPFSPEIAPLEPVSQDSLMLELQSGVALVEARDFEILSWEEAQDIKKELAHLSTRIASLTRSVALELRLRDSAAKLVRLSGPTAAAPTPANPASPPRPRVTREQAEAQLATAQAKLEAVQSDLSKLSSRESQLRVKLLQHTAAVLAASLRQKEQEENGLSTPAAAHTLSPALVSSSAAAQARHTPSPTGSHRFDGAHFFAGNREAVIPRARTVSANGTAGSPYASPQPSAGGAFGVSAVQLQHDLADREARVKDLEEEVASLKRQLEEVKRQAEADADGLREALDRTSKEAKDEQERARRELSSAHADVEGLREELHAARDDVQHERSAHETARQEAEEARRKAEEHRSQLDAMRSEPSGEHSTTEAEATRREAQDDAVNVQERGPELAETEQKLAEAEQRIVELEDELQRTEEEMKEERESLEDKVRQAKATEAAVLAELAQRPNADERDAHAEDLRGRIEQLEGERRSLTQAIGDVLRRHRTRPALGSALREAPALEDAIEGRDEDSASLIVSILDAHFDQAGSHVEHITAELTTLHEHGDMRVGLEDELAQAHDRIHALEGEVESLQAERESLETELDLLRSQTRDHEARLTSVPQLEADLSAAQSATSRAQEELTGSKTRLAELEERLEVSATQEVAMLERLNDLTESLEQTKRKLEADKAQLQEQLAAATQRSPTPAIPASGSPSATQEDLQELRDQIVDLEEELADAQRREQKTRSQLLEELSGVQNELSQARTKLRQAERKLASR